MLWSEFKALVEEELQGSDPEIFYIDTHNYPKAERFELRICDDGLIIE